MSKTKDRIVEKALELYNIQGIEYVGVRELAKELNMKGGNITYYFPTKNDLILEIQKRLGDSNSELLNQKREVTIYNFLELHTSIYINQYQYRAMFVSFPLLLKQNGLSHEHYKERHVARKKSIYNEMKSLFLKGYFNTAKADDMDTILNAIIMNNRLWISEATADGIIEERELAISTYIKRLAGLLHIISSDKGKEEIKQFLAEI